MRLQNLLVAMGCAFLAATALIRLVLADLLTNVLLGLAIWLASSLVFAMGLMAATWWMLRQWSRRQGAIVLRFTERTATDRSESHRAA